MPTINAYVAEQAISDYLIDNNAIYGLVWGSTCEMSTDLATNPNKTSCADSPAYVNETLVIPATSTAPYSSST
jgi:hypothetical protein